MASSSNTLSIQMASSSNSPPETSIAIHELRYLNASNANVSNFVTVKLFNIHGYRVWKTQMSCLMETHDMRGIVDASFDSPNASDDIKIMKKYDNLLKGWIFGSINEALVDEVMDFSTAKDVWEKLDSIYNPSSQRDLAVTHTEAKQESIDKNVVEIKISRETGKAQETDMMEHKEKLYEAAMKGNWEEARDILAEHRDAAREEIHGYTVLHLAILLARNDFVRSFVDFIEETEVLEAKNEKGETALHHAVHYGNKVAAQLLVERNINLLTAVDDEGHDPLDKAYSCRDMDMFMCMYGANTDFAETEANGKPHTREAIQIVVDTIFDNQFSKALEMVRKIPELVVESDDVLMALASTFPCGLTMEEQLFYPSLHEMHRRIRFRARLLVHFFSEFFRAISAGHIKLWTLILDYLLHAVNNLIRLLIWMAYVPFFSLYFLSWKLAAWSGMVPFIKHIMEKKNKWEKANDLLKLVCDKIDESCTLANYDKPIIKATSRQNAYPVIEEILSRTSNSFTRDINGQDIIQLAILHRSQNLYKTIHRVEDLKLVYGTLQDGSGNNILHLVARLPPSHELNPKRGAALQLQREIQWFEEVKKLLVPTYIFKENIFKETPDEVFTTEHANLVKEAEAWMKSTAESCSIIAALITTIVFAAAITVPGGSNQETGTALLTKDVAFSIFGISNAISLFMSSTSLLVFMSILTARFAMEDFLVSLPRQLIIGLCTLLISVTSMMVAFSATLFIVFYRENPWMLGPICGLASLPITFFVSIQFPLLVDLFGSTYGNHFGE